MIKQLLWNRGKPRIYTDKLCQPTKRGGLSLPNIKYYSIYFEISNLARHWGEMNADLDWILNEQELTSPFKPMEALAQTIKNEKNNIMMNPILLHTKTVWQEVHKKCKNFLQYSKIHIHISQL